MAQRPVDMGEAPSRATRALTRRRFLAVASLGGGAALLAACRPSSPVAQPTAAPKAAESKPAETKPAETKPAAPAAGASPATAASPAAGASPAASPAAQAAPAKPTGTLKGTRLTIIAGNWYVPENNVQLDQLVAKLSADTGMEAKVERFADNEMDAKFASIVETGTGGDIGVIRDFDAFLYADKLVDVTDLSKEIGDAWGGWFDIASQCCAINGKWRALMIGQAPAAWNYRTNMFQAAGINTFPDTFDELLAAGRKLYDKGTPIGMTLGHAPGDGRSTNYPVLWAFGGKEFEADGKTVAINSPETVKACQWYVDMFKVMDQGSTAWLDPDNNQAFLAGKVSATVNVNTIYLAARTAANDPAKPDPAKKELIDTMNHANWPSGPAGRFGQYNINLWGAFASSQNREGQLAFLRAWHDKDFLTKWTKTGQSYFIPPFKGLENMDVWPDDPKLKIFRELNKVNRLPGTPGPPTRAAAQAVYNFVLVDMFAKAATGQASPEEAVKWAENEYKQIVAKSG
ncbi:MAG: extracellular solute-binding protein [Chloroflexi bacterium]|nr:extracellular solute-binding protein [Chloroflexota bacterium]